MCFWCRKLLVQKACCRHAVTILPAQNHGFSFCSRMLSVFHTEDECFMWEHEVSGKCFLTLDDREPAAPTVDRLCGVGRALPAGLPQASCLVSWLWPEKWDLMSVTQEVCAWNQRIGSLKESHIALVPVLSMRKHHHVMSQSFSNPDAGFLAFATWFGKFWQNIGSKLETHSSQAANFDLAMTQSDVTESLSSNKNNKWYNKTVKWCCKASVMMKNITKNVQEGICSRETINSSL